jgi:hypothetical protein
VDGGSAGGIAAGDAVSPAATGKVPQDAAVSTDRALPRMPSTVIKTGRLSIRLGHGDLGKAVNRANLVIARYGGFISSSTISSGRHESSTIVLRVPADRFDRAMSHLGAPGIHHHGQPTAIGSALRRSWQRATDVVNAVIVGAGLVIPVALLALAALLAGRRLLPAVRRRTSPAPATGE